MFFFGCEYIPRQGVVEVIWHDLLVAVTKRQNKLRKLYKLLLDNKCLYLKLNV